MLHVQYFTIVLYLFTFDSIIGREDPLIEVAVFHELVHEKHLPSFGTPSEHGEDVNVSQPAEHLHLRHQLLGVVGRVRRLCNPFDSNNRIVAPG